MEFDIFKWSEIGYKAAVKWVAFRYLDKICVISNIIKQLPGTDKVNIHLLTITAKTCKFGYY